MDKAKEEKENKTKGEADSETSAIRTVPNRMIMEESEREKW